MPATTKRLCKGTLGTSNATLYTTPAGSGAYTIIKAITLCNKTASAVTVTLKFAGTEVVGGHSVEANDTITIPFIDQVLEAGETIEGSAGGSPAVTYYISGKEATGDA